MKASFTLNARNDSYCGGATNRLSNTLNFLGEVLYETKNIDNAECILVDWGSEEPLRNILKLKKEIKSIIKIVNVPKNTAEKFQKDSPYSEVHAMNCSFRNGSGKYFLRIDQDTLVGYRFMDWFFNELDEKDYGFDWPKVAFSGRRNLSPNESLDFKNIIKNNRESKKIEILHPLNYKNFFWPTPSIVPFYGSAVGIMMVERNLFEKYRGFNEELIYMNQMDTEFLNRLCQENEIYNLSQKTENDFYHQHHQRFESAASDAQVHAKGSGKRKTNSLLYRNNLFPNPNGEDWGLVNEKLEIYTYE